MSKKITVGLIAMVVLAASFNFIPEETDTHICIVEGKVTQSGYCNHLSGGSHTRCYKTDLSTENWNVCGTGWKAIDRSDMKFNYSTKQSGQQWSCPPMNQGSCVPS